MPSSDGIFWLASYPKSGNTWFRIVLANVLKPSDAPIDINRITTGAIASSREWVDEILGFDSGDLSHEEMDALRPAVYAWHALNQPEVGYHKIHDAYLDVAPNKPLIPKIGCLGAIYIVRNPLDVAVSLANHSSCSIDKAIDYLNQADFVFCKSRHRQDKQLRQMLLSWSMHVYSWVNAHDVSKLVLRYEDMMNDPWDSFSRAMQFLKIPVADAVLEQSIEHAKMDKLQAMEQESGFREKPANVARFFRKGIVGDWRNVLTKEQAQRIIVAHKDTMGLFGYLDEAF